MQSTFQKPTIAQKIANRLGFYEDQRMFWSFYSPRNFGDWIGPILYYKHIGKSPYYVPPRKNIRTFYTAGSIMRKIECENSAVVWGSGIISAFDKFKAPLKIHAVRGIHTRKRCLDLGYDCPEVYGDPGILLPMFFPKNTSGGKKYRFGLIPHYTDLKIVQDTVPFSMDVKIVNVTDPIEEIIQDIQSCEFTMSSSLHGLIVSHAYGIPSAWVSFGPEESSKIQGDTIKFQDYVSAFDEQLKPSNLRINNPSDIEMSSLSNHVDCSIQPDQQLVAERLWEHCPFR